MWTRRTVLPMLLTLSLAPASALAQEHTAALGGFGGLSLNQISSSRTDFGVTVGKELTSNIQVTGEFGRVGDMLPPLMAGLISLTPVDLRVSAYYGEGGLRLLAARRGISPYVEASAGIARLQPQVSGLGGRWDAVTNGALSLFSSTDPVLGVGTGVLLRGGPLVADLGYRYKQVVGGDSLASLLSVGGNLGVHQVRFGIGVRF